MKSIIAAMLIALGMSYPVAAQTTAPTPSTPATPSVTSGESRFKTEDKNNNGFLDGTELDSHKAALTQIDKDKDGRISRSEYLDGVKAGQIK